MAWREALPCSSLLHLHAPAVGRRAGKQAGGREGRQAGGQAGRRAAGRAGRLRHRQTGSEAESPWQTGYAFHLACYLACTSVKATHPYRLMPAPPTCAHPPTHTPARYFPNGTVDVPQGHYDMDLLNIEFKDDATLLRGETLLVLTLHLVGAASVPRQLAASGVTTPDQLFNMTRVVHFSPQKPWAAAGLPGGAHPRFYDAFRLWTAAGLEICPHLARRDVPAA